MNSVSDNTIYLKIYAFIISILIHIIIFTNVDYNIKFAQNNKNYLELDFFDSPKIVPESQAPKKKVETNKLAARDRATEKEQINRRQSETKSESKPQPVVKQQIESKQSNNKLKNVQTETKAETENKDLDNAKLLLSDNELNKFSSNNFQGKANVSDSKRAQTLSSNYQPFRFNRLFEKAGSSAYLPEIKEGEVTLLNAKADQYAVFVRRVAIQVFSSLRSKNWAQVGFAQARQTKKFATVEAKMNKQGKLVALKLTESSGAAGFDLVLKEAVKVGVWDQNPQLSAALEDGNIHFIFKAKTWAEIIGDPGRERRWLLLATGLK